MLSISFKFFRFFSLEENGTLFFGFYFETEHKYFLTGQLFRRQVIVCCLPIKLLADRIIRPLLNNNIFQQCAQHGGLRKRTEQC